MPIDPKAKQNIDDVNVYIKDTLMSISAKYSEAMVEAIENAFDNVDKRVIAALEKDLSRTFKNLVKSSDDISLNTYRLNQGLIGSKDLAKQQNSLAEKRILLDKSLVHLEHYRNELGEEIYQKLMKERDVAKKVLELQETELEKDKERSYEIEKRLGITGKLIGALDKIPGIGKFIDARELEIELRKTASNGAKQFQTFGLVIGKTFKQIGEGLTDPLFLLNAQILFIKKFFNLYGTVNQRIVDQGKQLGISKTQSEALYKSAFKYANNQKDSFITEQRILEGRNKLNEALGTSIVFTNEESITAEKLSTLYGLSAEQNASIATFAKQTNQTNNDVLNTVIKSTNEQKRQFGGSISYQNVLKKVSGVSGEILTKFKGNVNELTKAVMQADRLGLTLEQVDKIGESLLDFESSIENELKAELLTGKSINLEKARSAALSGDTVKLMNEITAQVGNIHQFEKMNVIQRKAYAEAFGMEVSEMGNMLRKKDLEAKLGVDIQKSATEALRLADEKGIKVEDSIRQELEQRSLAEIQKDVFLKIQNILAKISAGPMKTIFNLLEGALKFVEKIFKFFGQMTGGALGNALGTAIMGAPLLIGAIKLAIGTFKSMIFGKRGDNRWMPTFVEVVNESFGGGGTDGGGDTYVGGDSKRNLSKRARRKMSPQRRIKRAGLKTFGRQGYKNVIRGVKGFGIGTAVSIGADLIAGGMKEGTGKDVVSGIGQTASYAGTGAMIGSIIPGLGTVAGAVIGGTIGAIKSLFDAEANRRRREEEAERKREEQERSTNELLSQFLSRPIQLNVGGKTILDFNTASNLYGTQQSSFG